MSNALAIAGVSAVLKDLLDSGMIDHRITDTLGQGVTVSVLAPDAIQLGTEVTPRLNLFLHQVTPNAAWRNVGLPSRDAAGRGISNPPLALDLHYLLTAYAGADLQAEILLGYAMQLLHETPVLARDAIRTALNPPGPPVTGGLLPSVYQALRASDLADQVEQIKITPETMNAEELSKLWTALQSHYRPTATYMATVVLIESKKAARSSLPVLTRGPVDTVTHRERGVVAQPDVVPPFPEIESIALPHSRIAAQLGDTLTFNGHDLDGLAGQYRLLLSNPRLGFDQQIAPEVASSGMRSSVQFVLPNTPAVFPAGTHAATVQLRKAGEPAPRVSNTVPLTIAPGITSLPASINLDAQGDLTVTPACAPQVLPTQRVSLILGDAEALAEPFTALTATPSFVFRAFPTGTYWVRLRVDGVDSLLIDRSTTPPSFSGPQLQVLP